MFLDYHSSLYASNSSWHLQTFEVEIHAIFLRPFLNETQKRLISTHLPLINFQAFFFIVLLNFSTLKSRVSEPYTIPFTLFQYSVFPISEIGSNQLVKSQTSVNRCRGFSSTQNVYFNIKQLNFLQITIRSFREKKASFQGSNTFV